jgi:hypothetical protein
MSAAGRLPPTSRYAGLQTGIHTLPDRREVVYLRRRFCPPPERLVPAGTHRVVAGERLDMIAAREIGDAEQWWQVADANRAMAPDTLVRELGRILVIALPDLLRRNGGGNG